MDNQNVSTKNLQENNPKNKIFQDLALRFQPDDTTCKSKIESRQRVMPIQDPSILIPGVVTTFKGLSLEIREMIYAPLIAGNTSHITLLRTKKNSTKARRQKIRNAILFVDKQIHAEVVSWFYKTRIFVLGNGSYGSTKQANMKGLKEFVSRTPALNLESIRNLTIELHVRGRLWEVLFEAASYMEKVVPGSYIPRYTVFNQCFLERELQLARDSINEFKKIMMAVSMMINIRHMRLCIFSGSNFPNYRMNTSVRVSSESKNFRMLCNGTQELAARKHLQTLEVEVDSFFDLGVFGPIRAAVVPFGPKKQNMLQLSKRNKPSDTF